MTDIIHLDLMGHFNSSYAYFLHKYASFTAHSGSIFLFFRSAGTLIKNRGRKWNNNMGCGWSEKFVAKGGVYFGEGLSLGNW